MDAVVLAAVGLRREAALVGGPGVVAVAGGGDARGLRAGLTAAMAAATGSIVAVVSIGLGGALAPALRVGDWVIADGIVADGWSSATDARMAQALLRRLPTAVPGPIAAGDTLVADAAGKAELHARTGALAVDMESHVAACFAAEHALPFAALRVISDAADRALPPAARVAMAPGGGLNLPAIIGSLLARPGQLPALIRTAQEAEAAFRRLALLGGDHLPRGPRVGGPDLRQLLLDMA